MSEGTIITFYSYKGGVGRTLALANVGALLAQWGQRVLCIDWDLEAPGLHRYFERWTTEGQDSPGLVELVASYQKSPAADWQQHLRTVVLPGSSAALHLMAAGRMDEKYVERMQKIDWNELYAEQRFGNHLEELRDAWKESYDFVLIDSRTGVTDIGGICTIQLPDQLVALFTANWQGLEGVMEVAKRAAEQRQRLPFDRAGVPCVPVPTRFDKRVEYGLAEQWLTTFAEKLEPLYRSWIDADVTPREILRHLRIPYVARWSFGEQLPVIDEGTGEPESIGFAFETLAGLLAHGLAGTDLLIRRRDELVGQARSLGRAAKNETGFKFDVFISYPAKAVDTARQLANALQLAGLRAFFAPEDLLPGKMWSKQADAISEAIAQSRNILVLVGRRGLGNWQRREFEQAIELFFDDTGQARRIISVLLAGANLEKAHPFLGNLQSIRLQDEITDSFVNSLLVALA